MALDVCGVEAVRLTTPVTVYPVGSCVDVPLDVPDGGVSPGGVDDGGVDDGGVEDGGVDDGGVEDGGTEFCVGVFGGTDA